MMLAEISDTETAMHMTHTMNWLQFAKQDLQQCCLTSSVSTNLDNIHQLADFLAPLERTTAIIIIIIIIIKAIYIAQDR